jgi:EmrB/QacA subfamily drug resistance transporter
MPPAASARRPSPAVVLAVLAMGAMSYALLQSLVVPALPAIQQDLHTSAAGAAWVMTAYLLSASVATPIAGRLGDMFGKRRTLMVVLSMLALGTLVSALASSITVLIAGRAVQGLGGAVFPLAYGIIRDEFPPGRVAMGISLMSAILGIGGGAGIVLAGPILDGLGYHWLFWIPLLPILAAVAATAFVIPESPLRVPGRINLLGGLLLGGWLVCLLLAFSYAADWGWGSARFLGLLVLAAALFAGWVWQESRAREPLVDMRMMRLRGMWTTNVAAVLTGFGMLGAFVLVPQLVELPGVTGFGFGGSVTEAGLFLLPATLAMLIVSPLAARLAERTGSRLNLILGMAIMAGAFLILGLAHSASWQILLAMTLVGIGIGFAYAALANLVVEAVPPGQTGVATGMNAVMRTIGSSLGGQITASVIAAQVALSGLPLESGFTLAFLICAGAMTLGVAAGVLVPGREAGLEATAAGRVAAVVDLA